MEYIQSLLIATNKHLRVRVIGNSESTLRTTGKDTFVNIRKYPSNSEASSSIDKTQKKQTPRESSETKPVPIESLGLQKTITTNNNTRGQGPITNNEQLANYAFCKFCTM